MRAGRWRDASLGSSEVGAYMGSFTATAGPLGRDVLHVDEQWRENTTEAMLALHEELSSFRGKHHSGDRFADELIDRRGETARVARQRKLWDLTSSESSDEDVEAVARATFDGSDYSGTNSRQALQSRRLRLEKSPRSPEARILRRVGRGWERGDVERANDEDDRMRQIEMRDVKAVARQCFELIP